MVKTKEEIMTAIRERIGEDSGDSALELIENISDTIDDYENKIKGDGKDWKAEAEKIDKEWREKYKARFFGKVDEGREESPEIDPEQKALKFEDLFKEE